MRYTVDPITAETRPVGEPVSEPTVLEWVGQFLVRARYAAMAREALSYKWQGGDPA